MPEENPGGVIYGLIVIGALLAAESYSHRTYPEVLGSLALTIVVYWVAHAYSTALGHRLRVGGSLTLRSLIAGLLHDRSVLVGAIAPLLALLFCLAGGVRIGAALTAAVWSVVASLLALEVLAGVRAKAAAREMLLDAFVGAALGVAVLGMRLLLH